MGRRVPSAYVPDRARADAYDDLYEIYLSLHDHFADGAIMHRLRALR
jgi:L-ribulokinase